LHGFFDWMKARDDMYFGSRDQLLGAYQAFGANVAPVLPRYFNLRPRTDYEVRLVEPFREASASAGQYQGPSLDGKRAGIFYVNAYDLKARPRWALASLSLHEAAPGHHFQISLQRELTDLPCSGASRATLRISKGGACMRSISVTRWASTRTRWRASARSTPSCGARSAW
jgi:uncharacterized protein (DUF885 family)